MEILYYLLACHFISDFLKLKLFREKSVIKKSLVYFLFFTLTVFIGVSFERPLILILYWIPISVIDCLLPDNNSGKGCLIQFVFKQFLFFLFLIFLNYCVKPEFRLFMEIINVKLFLLFVLIVHPGSELIKNLMKSIFYTSDSEEIDNTTNSAGNWIGIFERMIIVMLVIFDEVGAIGLVIAAKSLARYKQLGNDDQFTEKFLIGTLSSVSLALILGKLLV